MTFTQIRSASVADSGRYNEFPSSTTLSDGGYVVAWIGYDGGGNPRIFVEHYDALGALRKEKTMIAEPVGVGVNHIKIVALPDGKYAVSWLENTTDSYSIQAQIHGSDDTLLVGEIQVNQTMPWGSFAAPEMVSVGDGFAVSFITRGPESAYEDVNLRIFDGAGSPVTDQFIATKTTLVRQSDVSLSTLQDGNIVVIWTDVNELSPPVDGGANGSGDIRGRIISPTGVVVKDEFIVNAVLDHTQGYPSVTALESGGFVAVWSTWIDTGGSGFTGFKARIYDAAGMPGDEIVLHEHWNTISMPAVTALSDGGFVLTWQRADEGIQPLVVKGFNAQGALVQDELVIDQDGFASITAVPVVSALPHGGFVVAWWDYGQIKSQVFGSPELASFEAPVVGSVALPASPEDAAITITTEQLLVNAFDPDSNTLTISALTITSGHGNLVNHYNGTWTYTPGYNETGSVSFSFDATDDTTTVTASATLDITPVNDAPHSPYLLNIYVNEKSLAGTVVGSLYSSDPDGPSESLTFTLLDNAGGRFAIQDDKVVVADGTLLDFDLAQSHEVTVRVTDAMGAFTEQTMTIYVQDVTDAGDNPVDTTPPVLNYELPNITIQEDASYSFVIPPGTFIDDSTLTYSISQADGSPLPYWLSIDPMFGSAVVQPPVDFNGTVNLKVTATDLGGNSVSDIFTFTVSPVNDAPVDVYQVGGMVAENSTNGTEVSLLFGLDPDFLYGDEHLTYSLVDDAGGRFAIQHGNKIVVANSSLLDHEQAAIHQVKVRVTDSHGASIEQVMDITVSDVAETPVKEPVVVSGNYSLPDNVLNVTAVGKANVTLIGNELSNQIKGNDGKNVIDAGGGDDKLNGHLGNDNLKGGAGKDSFQFSTKLDKKKNLDKIADFIVKDDSIHLDNAIFKKLGKGSEDNPSKLNKKFFTIGTKAKDKDDYLIYDSKKGIIFYDADGSGKGKAVEFATLSKSLKMTEKDFFVI